MKRYVVFDLSKRDKKNNYKQQKENKIWRENIFI